MTTDVIPATKTPRIRKTLADLENLLEGTDLTYVAVGGKFRTAVETEFGHTYVSKPYTLRELIVWCDGFNSKQG